MGLKKISCINAVHNRAGRHSPNLAVQAELWWKTPFHKHILNVTRLWCRLTCMCQNRLTKKVFNWNLAAARINKKNLCFRMRSKFTALGLQHLNDVSKAHSAGEVLEYMDRPTCFFEDIEQKWQSELWNDQRRNGCGNKLRTYRTFKNDFSEEPYISMNITLSQRRALASLRCGVAPLLIETGRYFQLSVDEITYLICVSGSVETEKHFLMSCIFYADLRNELFIKAQSSHDMFLEWSMDERFNYLMSNSKVVRHTAKACHLMLQRREHKLF